MYKECFLERGVKRIWAKDAKPETNNRSSLAGSAGLTDLRDGFGV